ncbi:acetyltransferase [Streptomyces viridochromogenes]|uniref:Acetyltransferase n=1 Tax=Streptomyces viridochromogenes TaxID=1938 RepID=A0A0J7ZFV0_STRVR|nr:GNAT family N-acetyltransferase [Streptomyces viridochromogenes]KMS74976.1 acetyltransferase [Streptomyces viridochromogenes]KOG15994.1 acetyltransferase [Streptomyces viridochromogenes]KOG18493.1 acetyltransferase [Streptomyces viridochromogenes]
MTTTLRPTEPLQRNEDGTRSRRYQVCVNGRPVGALRLGTHPVFGDAVARIVKLRIEEPDRRRGRGTVAALAAEEVARGWGCRRVEVTVPGDAAPALRLATALGYVVRSRGMQKALGDSPPDLRPGSRARPMTEAEYGPWRDRSHEGFIRGWVERGVPEAEARAKAERDQAVLLPDGLRTRDAFLSVLEHEGIPVGTLWLATRDGGAYVYDVETDVAHRGKGHGRTLMLLAEAQAIAAGHRGIGLNVFAGNAPAERLYESLGYETRLYALYKTLL